MDEERGTQRKIAKSYRDRVQARFTRTTWKRTRFLLSVLLFVGGVAAIYYYEKSKSQEFFNIGPLSRSHAHLKKGVVVVGNAMKRGNPEVEAGCASCHVPERLTSSSAGQAPG